MYERVMTKKKKKAHPPRENSGYAYGLDHCKKGVEAIFVLKIEWQK